jgi:acylphosphatase
MVELTATAPTADADPGRGTLVVVRGRVQRVGFRAFVRERARALGVAGWTCNLPDGSVAVAAGGPAGAVQALRSALADGPAASTVAQVEEIGSIAVAMGQPFAVVSDPPPDAITSLAAWRRAGSGGLGSTRR